MNNNEDAGLEKFIKEAAIVARSSTCQRSKCGSVVVKDNEIIGAGFNSPPGNLESQRRCRCEKDAYDKKVTDKTCCIHAEQRAMFDALRKNPEKVLGADIYFIRLNTQGQPKTSSNPYCTMCSKMALDIGIKRFILSQKSGITPHSTEEYNKLSYEYSSGK